MIQMYDGVVNSIETVTTGAINATDTIINVLDETRIPEAPNILVLGSGASAETVKLVEKNGSVLTVERGLQGTAKSWASGTLVARNFTEYDHRAFKENIEDLAENQEEFTSHLAQNTQAHGGIVPDTHLANGQHQNVEVTSTADATSVTNAPLKSAGGLAVAKKAFIGTEIEIGPQTATVFMPYKVSSPLIKNITTAGQTAIIDILAGNQLTNSGSFAAVEVMIQVAFTSNQGIQSHFVYRKLTVNNATSGGGTAIETLFDGSAGGFSAVAGNFSVTRPSTRTIRITYTSANNGNTIRALVTGIFNTATIT